MQNRLESIIFLTPRIPYPPNKGDKIRAYNILQYLSKYYNVYLGTFIESNDELEHIRNIEKLVYELNVTKLGKYNKTKNIIKSFLSSVSISEKMYYSDSLEKWLVKLVNKNKINKIYCFSSMMGQYLKKINSISSRITDFVDLDSEKWNSYQKNSNLFFKYLYNREYIKVKQLEEKVYLLSTKIIFVSNDEALLFNNELAKRRKPIITLNNGVDYNYFNSRVKYSNPYHSFNINIVFTGVMGYKPNIDGILWFYHHIFKILTQLNCRFKLWIVGSSPHYKIINLSKENKNVIVTGHVNDIRGYLKYAHCAIAPLLIARGVQNKVLEAMSMGLPIVVSKEASTGLSVPESKAFLIAKCKDDWLSNIINIINVSEDEKKKLRAHIIENYAWESCLKCLPQIINH